MTVGRASWKLQTMEVRRGGKWSDRRSVTTDDNREWGGNEEGHLNRVWKRP